MNNLSLKFQAKDLGELKTLVAKHVSEVLRFSDDRDLQQNCYKFLNVTNYYDAEKAIYQQLAGPTLNTRKETLEDEELVVKFTTNKRKVRNNCVETGFFLTHFL
jgi:hypothetical protein